MWILFKKKMFTFTFSLTLFKSFSILAGFRAHVHFPVLGLWITVTHKNYCSQHALRPGSFCLHCITCGDHTSRYTVCVTIACPLYACVVLLCVDVQRRLYWVVGGQYRQKSFCSTAPKRWAAWFSGDDKEGTVILLSSFLLVSVLRCEARSFYELKTKVYKISALSAFCLISVPHKILLLWLFFPLGGGVLVFSNVNEKNKCFSPMFSYAC